MPKKFDTDAFYEEIEPEIQQRLRNRLAVARIPLLSQEGAVGVPVGTAVRGSDLKARTVRQGQAAEASAAVAGQARSQAASERDIARLEAQRKQMREQKLRRQLQRAEVQRAVAANVGLGESLGKMFHTGMMQKRRDELLEE